MKKGISLIVLVITIIVMIIIAGAIIISLNSSNVIDRANEAVVKTDVGTIRDKVTVAYVDLKAEFSTIKEFTVDDGTADSLVVADEKYDDLTDYYTTLVPELANLDGLGYKYTINPNGTVVIEEKTETPTTPANPS